MKSARYLLEVAKLRKVDNYAGLQKDFTKVQLHIRICGGML